MSFWLCEHLLSGLGGFWPYPFRSQPLLAIPHFIWDYRQEENQRERGGRGNIYFLDKEQVFYYNSASATASAVVFNYFDKFQLNSSKLIRYLKWRQAYRIVQRKEHLTEKGLNKIRKLQGNLRD